MIKTANGPLISVICISYNQKQYIERCLLSVISQTYKNFEIIYLDNNSHDGSFEEANRVLESSGVTFYTIHSKENLGVARGLNAAINTFAKGKYIATLACDDFWDMYNLEEKTGHFEKNPDDGMLYANGYYYNNDTKEITLYYKQPSVSGKILRELLAAPPINPVGIFYRHDVLKELNYFDPEAKVEDRDLWYRIARNYSIGYLHTPLTFYRIHGSNVSFNVEYMRDGNEYFFRKYENEFPVEIRQARQKQEVFFAYVASKNDPSFKSFFKILKNYQFNWPYTKEVIRSFLKSLRFKM